MYEHLIVDASNNLHRFLRTPEHYSSANGGLVGFANLTRAIASVSPNARRIFVWDGKRSERRLSLYPEYKKNRSPTTETEIAEFKEYYSKFNLQKNLIVTKLLPALGGLSITFENKEADDVIAKILQLFPINSLIVSEDMDLSQLCRVPHVRQWMPIKDININLENLEQVTGVAPELYMLYKAMIGDRSDNIKGVYGVGPETAKKLLADVDKARPVESLLEIVSKSDKVKINKVYKDWGVVARNLDLIDLNREPFNSKEVEWLKKTVESWKSEFYNENFKSLSETYNLVTILRDYQYFIHPFLR